MGHRSRRHGLNRSDRSPSVSAKRRRHDIRVRDRNKAFLAEYLRTHPCVDCGEPDIVVLEFDHIRGHKTGCVKQMARDCSMDTLVREVRKCEVRCSNCHKRRHYLEKKGCRVAVAV